MVQVVASLSAKGGVGKSAVTRSLAIAGLMVGRKVAIIDSDPQGTCIAWGKRRQQPAPTIMTAQDSSIAQLIKTLRGRGADLILIDTPPHSAPLINQAATAATSCLIVTGVYPEDIEAVSTTVRIVKALKKPAAILLNRTARSQALILARTALGTFGLPICPTAISQLVAHPYASSSGLAAQEYEPDGKAAGELAAVWEWLVREGLI